MVPPRLRFVFLAALLSVCGPAVARAELPTVTPTVIASYPHDTNAFTEGLLFRDGFLYESTGREGVSDIRKVELTTGKVVQRMAIPPQMFGEGLVDWKDSLLSYTWRDGAGFRWGLKDFKQRGTFTYDGEGWAMTQDGKSIIMSDGTSTLRFVDPKTMKVVRRLAVTAEGAPVDQLNEIEYVKGEILANIWMTGQIARIDPVSGHIKGWIEVGALWDQVATGDPDAVPNGIAYDKVGDRLFVTGKNWPLLFEIRLPD